MSPVSIVLQFVIIMNEEVDYHDHSEGLPTATFALVAGICSSLFGFFAALTNSLILFTVFKDPYNYFRSRATTYFIVSLSVSDLLGGSLVQPMYAASMFTISTGGQLQKLYEIALIFSHVTTKISILTVVALSLDRFLAVKLSLRYRRLITVRKVIVCNALIWIFCITFETSHSLNENEEVFHLIDLHLQTTIPLTIMCALYTATYIEFRRYSRNVFVRTNTSGRSRILLRNIGLEKKIVSSVVLIIIVLFISLLPYLIVTNLQERCQEKLSSECSEPGFLLTKALSVPLLCVSCALNPFLYAWRIPQYRQVLRLIGGWICQRFRRRSHTVNALVLSIPTVLASVSLVKQNTPAVGHLERRRSEEIVNDDCDLRN